MKTKQLIKNELARLNEISSEPEADLRVLFEHYTGKDYYLVSISEEDTDDVIADKIHCAVSRRIDGEPCQYIVGEQYFMGNRFIVSPDVLIPRSDTEIICESVIDYLSLLDRPVKVLDLCTGSGCIGISIALAVKNASVDCTDISDEALEIVSLNAQINCVSDRVRIYRSDMLDSCGVYDVIVSNPPYIPSDVIATLDGKVKDHEPLKALDGGRDGLDFYRIIASEANEHLENGGRIFLEIGYDQKDAVSAIFARDFKDVISKKDYSGNNRMVACSKKE